MPPLLPTIITLITLITNTPTTPTTPTTTTTPTPTLRLSLHVFLDNSGEGNFHPDSANEVAFLNEVIAWINHKAANLDTLTPPVPSPYMKDAGFRIRLDTIYFHKDSYAWDCSGEIDASYMRSNYVDRNPGLDYRQKYQTLPVLLGANNPVVGGHSRTIGDKGYIAMRGFYHQYLDQSREVALMECARNLFHEIGHCVGLMHNFRSDGGGNQCDPCDDNGCPGIGTSNNVMDLWPGYGHALSECQVKIIQAYLGGRLGNISDVLINDSCYTNPGADIILGSGDTLRISDTVYLHGNVEVGEGAALRVEGYLSVPAGASIHVLRGGTVTVSGGTIGNLCGDLWSGLLIDNQYGEVKEIVFSDGASIENARVAIQLAAPALFSGNGVNFRNCARGIFLAPGGGSQLVDSCHFSFTEPLNHHEEGMIPLACIHAESIENLSVTRCRFINEPGTYSFPVDSSGTGIFFEGDSLRAEACGFSQLTYGIRSRTSEELLIEDCTFDLNRCGLYSSSSGYLEVNQNYFSLQRFNEGPAYGIVVQGSPVFSIRNNRFASEYGSGKLAGICLVDPGEGNSLISGNTFKNLPMGILFGQVPRVDEYLFEWASGIRNDYNELRLGPHLKGNIYDRTPVHALLMEDSTHGTAIGVPETFELTDDIKATGWPAGGYWWYDKTCPLAAFAPIKQADRSDSPSYGLYVLRNLETGMGEQPDQALMDSLKLALQVTDRLRKDPGAQLSGDLYQDIKFLREFPITVSSGYLNVLPGSISPEETAWTRQALASIAGVSSTALNALQSLDLKPSGPEAPVVADMEGILPGWPDGKYYRFIPPAGTVAALPGFSVRPIPATTWIRIYPTGTYVPDDTWTYQIFGNDGRLCHSGRIPGWQLLEIPVDRLAGGVYFIRIFSSSLNLGTQEFIIDP
jgi:hypothetical protein